LRATAVRTERKQTRNLRTKWIPQNEQCEGGTNKTLSLTRGIERDNFLKA